MNKLDITSNTINSFSMYKFLSDVSKPYTSFSAYAQGIIDNQGFFKVSADEVANSNVSTFELFIIYLKRLFDQIANPTTRSLLSTTSGAMTLFKEELDFYGLNSEKFFNKIESMLNEQEAPVNVVGSGNIAGIPQGGKVIDDDGYMNLVIKQRKKKRNPLSRIKRPQGPIGLESSYWWLQWN